MGCGKVKSSVDLVPSVVMICVCVLILGGLCCHVPLRCKSGTRSVWSHLKVNCCYTVSPPHPNPPPPPLPLISTVFLYLTSSQDNVARFINAGLGLHTLDRGLGKGRCGVACLGVWCVWVCGYMAPPTRTVPYPCPQIHIFDDGESN